MCFFCGTGDTGTKKAVHLLLCSIFATGILKFLKKCYFYKATCGSFIAKRNIRSRLLLRDLEKATKLFGKQYENSLQVVKGDTINADDFDPSMFKFAKYGWK
ncbi:hypothetical protein AALP_AA7G159200 [Arabis alpina]|uniref:Uncharacterized protein n=1 Tax=Arabis alpina TaxID=50452 RepID=A0A087GID2_ARAAL|nr:hypothetical protein AALP_AA7G159200 [Arabis alpina]